jgi:hypothetical protein
MPLGKRRAGADDGQTELDKLDELSHDLAFACNINDYAAATRVYDRFLSVLQPGADLPPLDARQFPLTLGKRKTGAETAPCAMEILQELSHDMWAAVGQEDFTACDRIYDRFLAERKNGVVSRSNVEHSHDTPETRQPQDEEWTRPRTKPSRV